DCQLKQLNFYLLYSKLSFRFTFSGFIFYSLLFCFLLLPFIPHEEKTKGQDSKPHTKPPTRGGDRRSPMDGGDGASFNIVFIDTTLDTHLAMDVSYSDTVADLKKRIVEEHSLCFPKCGEIRIDGLKVKRRGLYYSLAESMLVKSAFDGVKNSWFISVEASSVSKGKEIEGFLSYEEEAGLALVSVENNGLEKEGVGLVHDVPRGVLRDGNLLVRSRNEASSSLNQSGSRGADEVAATAELRGGGHGKNVQSLELVIGFESRREEKVDEEARDMEVQATETEIDSSMLLVGDLNRRCDGQAQNKRVPEVQLGHLEHIKDDSKKDDLVSEQTDKPSMEASEHEPVAKKLKTRKGMENEGRNMGREFNETTTEPPTVCQLPIGGEQRLVNVNATVDGSHSDGKKKRRKKSFKQLDNVVSELNEMTSEPPTLSQLPVEDPQPLVNATMEGSDAGTKKRRKKKSSSKMDKEVNAVDQQSLKEAGGDNGNLISELNDTACEPPTLSQLPIADEQPLINATMEVSDAEVKNKGKKKSSDKMDKEVNADDDQSLNEAGGDNGNMVPEQNDMTSEPLGIVVPEPNLMSEPPTVSQLPIGDEEQLMNATMESSDASMKMKRKKSSKKKDKEVDAVDEQSLKEAGGNSENVVSEPNDLTFERPGNVVSEPNDMTWEPLPLPQLLVNASMEGSDAGVKKKRKKKSSSKMDKEDTAIHQQSLKEAEGNNGNVGDEQLMNATVEGSDGGTKKKRKKNSSNKIYKEVNAGDEQSLKEAAGDNGNMVSAPNDMISEPPVNVVPEPNDMTCEPPIASQISKADEQLVNATVEGSDAGVKKKRKSSSKIDKKVYIGDEQSLKEAAGDNGNMVSEPNDMISDPPVNVVPEPNDMTCEPPIASQISKAVEQLVNATVEGSDAGVMKKRKKKSSSKIDKKFNAGDEQSLKEAAGDNGNMVSEPNDMISEPPVNVVPELNDMTGEPPIESQISKADEQLVNATVEGSDAGVKKKRKKKSSSKIDKKVNAGDEQSQKEAAGDNGNMVSELNFMISEPPVSVVPEPNAMTCEPPIASQLSKADEQLVNATMEGSDATVKKKRKKSSIKIDKEVNDNDEQSLKEAADDNGNLVAEQEVDFPTQGSLNVLQPSAVSVNEDTGPVQEAHRNNSPSQDINDFQKPVPDEMHETDKVIASQTISTPEEVHSELPDDVPSLQLQSLSTKKRKKSKKNKDSVSEIPVAADLEIFKDTAIDNSIHEAPEKGSAIPAEKVKEGTPTESLRASLLVTEEEINEVIKNVVDSSHQGTESKAVAEAKEEKTKKQHGSDAKNSLPTQAEDENTGEHVPVPPTVNAQDTNSSPTDTNLVNTRSVGNDAEEFNNNGVNFLAYFSPNEQDKKTSDRNEVTGAWRKTMKGKKKRKAQDDVPPKLPEAPSMEVNRLSEVKPTHSESSTKSTSHVKRGNNKIQPLHQQGGSKVGSGSKANTGEVVNGKVRPNSGTSLVFERNLFGDGSSDSLETYVFPSLYQSRSSTPDPYSNVSPNPDGDSDAGFDDETRKGTKTSLTKDISLGDILAPESQPEDFASLSPSI
ncbi:hypothetical protein LINPERPRIM_LOCUS714, partial [Linum perenne]